MSGTILRRRDRTARPPRVEHYSSAVNNKLYTKSDRTSCHRWEANQFRLFLHTGAYWLLHQLRQAAPRKSLWRTATFETLRRAFLKIAVRVEELKSRLRIALPSAYPYQPAMIAIAGRITAQGP